MCTNTWKIILLDIPSMNYKAYIEPYSNIPKVKLVCLRKA